MTDLLVSSDDGSARQISTMAETTLLLSTALVEAGPTR